MKGYQVFVVITILVVTSLLSGCNSTTPLIPTATPTYIPNTTLPTKQGPTPTQTPTPVPQVVWADALKKVSKLHSRSGEWSPTANTYLYVLNEYVFDDVDVQLVMAPLFEPYTIANHFSYDDTFFWAPDGQTIFFHTFLPDDMHIDGRPLWSTDLAGNNPQIIARNWFATGHVDVKGWLDSQTVVISHYFGGLTSISAYNISTAKWLDMSAGVHGDAFAPQHGYIPVTSDTAQADPRLMVIGERFRDVEYQRAGGNLRLLPPYNNISIDYSISQFEDWLGDSNQILVFWGHMQEVYGKGPLETNLLLWDVDKNSLRLLAPGGVGGKFSPDGKYMAYMTFGPVPLNQTANPTAIPTDEAKTEPLYLQLLDMSSNKVILSLPSFSDSDYLDFIFHKHQFLYAKFSSDSRYLAFVTPGEIETDANHWSLRVTNDPSHRYIHVLDLQTKQVIWSALSNGGPELSWSPDNMHLLFQNQDNNWFLYSTSHQNAIPVTKDHGSVAVQPAWSYDGQYFRFFTCPPLDDGVSCRLTNTVIFSIAENKP